MMKVVAKNFANEGKVGEAIKLFEELVQASRKEDGCIKYELYQDKKDASVLTIIEEWEDTDALKKHMKSEHFIRIMPLAGELMTKQAEINIYKKLV